MLAMQEYYEDQDAEDDKALTGLPHTMIDSLLRFKFQKQRPSYFLGAAGAKPVRAPQAVDDSGRPLIEVCKERHTPSAACPIS